MASQALLLPFIGLHPTTAFVTCCSPRREVDRACKFSVLQPTHNNLVGGIDTTLLREHFTRNTRSNSSLKAGRFKVWAQESSFNSYISIKENDFAEEKAKEKSGSEDQNLLLRLLIVAVVAAAVATVLSVWQINGHKWDGQASNIFGNEVHAETGVHFGFNLFGTNIRIGEGCPGWVYFWLLMAAGFGLFVSEEALNVWVGATLARTLTFNGTWMDFARSVLANASYIFPTIFWVYWGVCISDMVPFYAGKFAAQTKTGDKLREKVGVNEAKLQKILQAVQRHGNLIGFVERFSLGVRNPTSFLAGAMGISPQKYFAGVCLGALITLPLQMGVGFVLRDRPMAALAGVAAVVGAWTILPYATAGLASIIYVIRKKLTQQHVSGSEMENISDK